MSRSGESASKLSTRTKKVTVRLSVLEYHRLKEMSEQAGLKMEPFLRRLIEGREVRARPTAETAKLMQEFSGIGNNINQIARVANAALTVSPEDIAWIIDMQKKIWERIRTL